MSRAYYNEFNPFAAQWLRNLISAGLIAPGDVDERSIENVKPTDLVRYAQCHFFAGVVGRMLPRLESLGFDPATIARLIGRRDSTLVHASRNRVGRLQGYGNAINKEVTQTFIKAVMTCNR